MVWLGHIMTSIGRLHVITDEQLQSRYSHAQLAAFAAAGGADLVQFREKRPRTTRELIETACAIQAAIGDAPTALLIDDRVDVAAATNAAVHLGRDDLPPDIARRILGPGAIIGGTANSLDEAQRVAAQPVDYLGVGPVFGTTSKGDRAAPMLGLDALREIVAAIDKPVIAIGSITADNVASVLETGAHGIAVLSAVVCADDPQAATREIRATIDRALQ